MEQAIAFLNVLNGLSPLAVIGLLAYIIYLQVKGKTAVDKKVETVASNHLHELPEAVAILRNIDKNINEIRLQQAGEFSYIRARLNGGQK